MTEIFTNDAVLAPDQKQPGEVESPISKKLKSKNGEERLEALKIKEKQEKHELEVNSKTKTQ
jgi:hypothetical protein